MGVDPAQQCCCLRDGNPLHQGLDPPLLDSAARQLCRQKIAFKRYFGVSTPSGHVQTCPRAAVLSLWWHDYCLGWPAESPRHGASL